MDELQTKRKTGYVSDTTSLTIDLIGDSFINYNIQMQDLKEVTNPVRFVRGTTPTADGLFSTYIFGSTPEERKTKFAYIDLHTKVFHPYAYEVIKRMWAKIDQVASGQSSWKILEDGTIEEDPEGDPDNTGMDWLVKNFRKIVFKETGSHIRDERMKLISSLKDDELFISKWLVIPVFYRDIQEINGNQNVPPINKNYTKIIQYASAVERDPYFSNIAKYNIQLQLIEIRKYGQSLVEKKRGFFKRNVLGKSIDYGYRSVISVYHIDAANRPEDNPIDIFHTGIPLSQVCVLFFPFIKRYVRNFLRDILDTMGNRIPIKRKDGTIEYIETIDPMAYYDDKKIQTIIDQFVNTPGVRFRPVMIPTEEGEFPLHFTGNSSNRNPDKGPVPGIGNRVMTWTDLLYIAAVDSTSDKHVYITRYPLEDYFGTFPSRVFVLSTMKTTPIVIDGKLYKYYPVIDPTLPESEVSTLFNDTLTMDNCYLKGLGGDFDGDMVSIRGIFGELSNKEAEEILHSVKHYVNIAGDLMRVVGNEAFLTYYNMTKD